MVGRNSKGQILLEAVFLITVVVGLLVLFQALIEKHRLDTKSYKLSTEKNREFRRDHQ